MQLIVWFVVACRQRWNACFNSSPTHQRTLRSCCTVKTIHACQAALVAAELAEALVADPEVVGDLVQDDVADRTAKPLGVGAGEPFERPAVDRDLVRRDAGIAAAARR